jgi:hypothetical protein
VLAGALAVEESMRGKLASAKESGTIEALMATYEDADFKSLDGDYSSLTNLLMATCTRCDGKFFVRNPEPTRRGVVRTHEQEPNSSEWRRVFPDKCPRCGHAQFVEVWYHH